MSLIKHGALSTRAKDVFDLYYLTGEVNRRVLQRGLQELIFANKRCPVREPVEIVESVGRTFQSKRFLRDMASAKANWLKLPPQKVAAGVLGFLKRIMVG